MISNINEFSDILIDYRYVLKFNGCGGDIFNVYGVKMCSFKLDFDCFNIKVKEKFKERLIKYFKENYSELFKGM